MVSWYSLSLVLKKDSVSWIKLPRFSSCWGNRKEGTTQLGGKGCRVRVGDAGSWKGSAPNAYLPASKKPCPAHLALQVNARIAVSEVLPEQKCVFVLLPRQAVTVIVEIKGLPPVGGGTQEGMSEQSQAPGAWTGESKGHCPDDWAPARWPSKKAGAVAKGDACLLLGV